MLPQLLTTAVADLTSDDQWIRCIPYAATVRASCCLERQRRHGQRVAVSASGRAQLYRQPGYATRLCHYGRCRDCELGRAVAERVGDSQ